ncbi:hypothetical protein B1H18_03070 [Streptomyces tsukubensis]|uniref:Anti-sigma factor antagonist n=1 Tax=Streptomyces tsukubensis TaxID=83656 RepID=A0A1V4AFG1_9ACTN|nr:hypothetical protein B1H18_03070 [Streptomyces tsukubensis]
METAEGQGEVLLTLEGDLDYETAALLHSALEATAYGPGRRLALDLSGLVFFDSGGINALLAVRRSALDAGAELTILRMSSMVERIFGMTGLDEIFAPHDGGPSVPGNPEGKG